MFLGHLRKRKMWQTRITKHPCTLCWRQHSRLSVTRAFAGACCAMKRTWRALTMMLTSSSLRADMQRVRAVLKELHYLALPTLGRGSHTFFVGYHPATEGWVTLDIVTELTFGPYLNIRTHAAEGILARRRQATPSLYTLAPDDGFWTLFLHCLLDKGYFASHRAARLQELAGAARTDSPLARLVALNCPGGWNVTRLVECVRRSEWDVFTSLAPYFHCGVAAARADQSVAGWLGQITSCSR